ncbi:hypothetical protein Syun_021718 [Stephania yunnanensis]|uniref:Uncharacterized protein n=1 Tax=Stephania yunnanensis TaxID=152371 RepID=A0AAP0IG55_9MAGN
MPFILRWCREVKGRVYGLGSQGYHRDIFGGASSSQGPAYGLHELEELQWTTKGCKKHCQGANEKTRTNARETRWNAREETREMRGQSDDHPGHLTTEITPSQSGHPHDHRSGRLFSPHRRMSEDQRHLLDDHDEFMEQLMPPPPPPPRQEYVQRSRLICVLHKEANLPHHLGCKFQRILWRGAGRVFKEGRGKGSVEEKCGWFWRERGGDGFGFGQRDVGLSTNNGEGRDGVGGVAEHGAAAVKVRRSGGCGGEHENDGKLIGRSGGYADERGAAAGHQMSQRRRRRRRRLV